MSQLLFSYQGRIGIKEFWIGILTNLISIIVLSVVMGVVIAIGLIATKATPQTQHVVTLAGSGLIVAYAIYVQFAITVKRCHDRGRSGWWSLLTLIPFIGLVWMILDLGIMGGKGDAGGPRE
jgi:uncharacterized membrane protein YhaH (DUF805 family)